MSIAISAGGEKRLRELDGWRAVSVFLVIVHHLGWYQYPGLVHHASRLGHVIHYAGALGVKTFFVISGFVICRLLILEETRSGAVSLLAFYYRRIFRILPPLYVYLAALLLLLASGMIHESWRAILAGGLFLSDIHFLPPSWFVGHTWSLAVEEQFYLVFPTTWVLTPQRWRGKVFGGIFFVCVAWNLSLVVTGWDSLVQTGTRAGFACISCGVLMAIYEKQVRGMAARVPAIVVALAALALLLHPVAYNSWQEATYDGLFVPPVLGLILMYSLERGPWLKAFLCSAPMQAIGLTSYGIYLWQQLFTAPLENYAGAGAAIRFLLPLLAVIVPVSYFFIEKPAMRYGKMLSRQARENTSARAAAIP